MGDGVARIGWSDRGSPGLGVTGRSPDDEFAVDPRRQRIRRLAIGTAVAVLLVVVAIAGYKIGVCNVADSNSAYQEGVALSS